MRELNRLYYADPRHGLMAAAHSSAGRVKAVFDFMMDEQEFTGNCCFSGWTMDG